MRERGVVGETRNDNRVRAVEADFRVQSGKQEASVSAGAALWACVGARMHAAREGVAGATGARVTRIADGLLDEFSRFVRIAIQAPFGLKTPTQHVDGDAGQCGGAIPLTASPA